MTALPTLRFPRRNSVSVAALLSSLAVAAVALAVSRGRFVQAQSARSTAPAAAPAAAPAPQDASMSLDWGAAYAQWLPVTGYLVSLSHGSRLVRIRATPMPAAKIYVRNAEQLRHLNPQGVKAYSVGTLIAMASWDLGADYRRGTSGPIFFMKKEPPGYDPPGGDWRYGMTRTDLSVLAEGKDGRAAGCRTCHLYAKAQDFVYASDR